MHFIIILVTLSAYFTTVDIHVVAAKGYEIILMHAPDFGHTVTPMQHHSANVSAN